MSLLTWTYMGDRKGADEGRQRAKSGDTGYDDRLGLGVIDKMNGSVLIMEFSTGDLRRVKERPAQSVYALNNREPLDPKLVVAPKGRSGSGMNSIGSFFGSSSASAGTKEATVAASGRGSKVFADKSKSGRGRGRGRGRGGDDASSSAPTPPTADKRKQSVATAAFPIGAEHAEQGGEEGSEVPSKKAKAGSVANKDMSTEELSEYRKSKVEEKKDESVQQGYKTKHSWLAEDGIRGWHCRLCINSLHCCSDKFSISGYGYMTVDEVRVKVPIPTTQKLKQHEGKNSTGTTSSRRH
tara:strand:+ start:94 stop:981 length:888 start_codon:yes stop_codon:yes gene_type:complete